MTAQAMLVHPDDNVAVALEDIHAGQDVELNVSTPDAPFRARERIPFGHKISIRNITGGQAVMKYGEQIGIATTDIPAGRHVHVHNLRGLRVAAPPEGAQ